MPDWERCQDGTAFTGKQTFYFYPADPGVMVNTSSGRR